MMRSINIIIGFAVFALAAFLLAEAPQASADQFITSTTLPAAVALGFDVSLDVVGGLRLTIPAAPVALGSISSLTGGNASGTADINVATTNYLGYTLALSSATNPAMLNTGVSEAIAASTAGYNFSDATVATSPALNYDSANEFLPTQSKFGFAVSSTDAAAAFQNNGSSCNSGSNISNTHCFGGLSGGILLPIAASSGATPSVGATSSIRFLAQMGPNVATRLAQGAYRASIIATAYAN